MTSELSVERSGFIFKQLPLAGTKLNFLIFRLGFFHQEQFVNESINYKRAEATLKKYECIIRLRASVSATKRYIFSFAYNIL